MIKRIKKRILIHYRIVKKFSTLINARLAQELLNIYHVQTRIVRTYNEAIYLLVTPQDYQLAHRVLY